MHLLEDIYRRHHREAYLWARQCCRFDDEMARDVMQQVYLKILEGRAKMRDDRHEKSWLFAVVRNTAVDALKNQHVHLAVESIPDQEEVYRAPDLNDYEAIIELLPKMQKEVILMVFYHGMTLEESARVLDLHIGTIRTHYDRGKKRIRQLIIQQSNADEMLVYSNRLNFVL